jgi:hypothetical protein
MERMLVVVSSDESKAYEGQRTPKGQPAYRLSR